MLLAILCTATQTLYAQTFSMASEASSQNTPSGWTAVDLPTGLPEITTANTFDITTYGASTSSSDNTTAIQAALDVAESAGGGMVVIPAGEWMFGRIQVGAKTILHLSAGATLKLLAYSNQPDHTIKTPYITNKSDATDIVIEGESKSTSIIEGQGGPWWDAVESNESGLQRGSMIRFTSGSRFLFRNFRIQNAPGTNLTLGNSGKGTHNTVHDISIYAPSSHASDPSHNTDGIPIWAAYANIYNCDIDTGDDNVVTDSNAQFIHVWNCDMKAGHGASLGSYTNNMHDIIYEGLTFTGTDCGFRLKSNRDRSGDVYNITFRNCTMTNVPSPISITSWYDTLPNSPEAAAASPDQLISTTPKFHDILIQNVTVSGHTTYKNSEKNYYGIFIYGRPESKVHDVTFDNVNITHSKGIKMNFCEGIKFYDNCSFEVSNTDKNAVAGDYLENVIEEKYDCAYNWKVEQEATSGTYFWKVTDTPAGGIVTHDRSDLIQIAFGTAVKDNANDWTAVNSEVTVTYKDVAYTFDKYATTSNVNGTNSSSLAADGSSTNNYIAFVPKYNGTLIVVAHNLGTGNTEKPTWCYEDGAEKNGTIIGDGTLSIAYDGRSDVKTLNNNTAVTGGIKISVKANKLYTLSVQGSKARWEGIIYEYTQGTPEQYTVTFTNNDSEATGTVPAAATVTQDESMAIPANKSLYKSGYTLTGWSDGTNTYAIGDNFTPTADVTLSPVFTANTVSMSDVTADKTVIWYFGKSNGAPDYDGSVNANVQQVTIGESTIDLGIKMSGGKNNDRTDEWMNNQQKNMMVPVIKGAIVKAKVYYTNNASFNGEEITYDADTHGAQGNVVYTYTYTGDEPTEIAVNVGNQFLSYISVTYPVANTEEQGEGQNFSITWSMANGANSTATTSLDNVTLSSSWTTSAKIEVNSTATYGGNVITKFNPTVNHNPRVERNTDYYVEWTFKPYPGFTFTPTSVSFDAVKCGTGDPTIDVDFTDGTGVTEKLATNAAINRDGSGDPAINHSYTMATATNGSGDAVTLRIYIGKCVTGKQVALGRVTINGKINGEKQTFTTVYNIASSLFENNKTYEGNTGTMAPTTAEEAANAPDLEIDATSGKLGENNADWAQIRANTLLTLPGVPEGANITFALYDVTKLTINNVDYANGETFTATEDMNVTMTCPADGYIKSITVTGPAFVEALIPSEAYTNTWYFGKSNGAPEFALERKPEYTYTVDDHSLVVNTDAGKLNNASRTDQWCQCNNGTLFKVPVFAGAKLSWGRYNGGSEAGFTIDGQLFNEYYIATESGTVEMTASGISYLSYIKIEPTTLYEVTGTISGGDINGSSVILTATGNKQKYSATVASDSFTMNVPADTYTPELEDDVAYVVSSPESVTVSAAGSIGTINIVEAQPQTVTGAIANAPSEAFTLTFTATNNASHTTAVNCTANATSFNTTLNPDTYTISSNVGTLSPLSVESFKVVKSAVTHNIYYPEAASPAATQQEITVDNTITTESANNYKTVTDALAAANAGGISAPVITLTSGQTYREKVIVDIADVTFKTSGTEKATITFYYGTGYCYYSLNSEGVYDKDRAMTRNSIIKRDPERWGATVKVTRNGKNFKAENIIFENSFNQYYTQEEIIDGVQPNGVQSITYDRTLTANESGYKAADSKAVTERAAAIAFEGDPKGCQLYNCEFRGSQDTFYTGSSNTLYVKDCNIIGNTDYIFGGGYVVFDNCDLTIGGYSDQDVSAYITAYKDGDNLEAGKCYVFRDCTVKGSNRTHVKANLGRDWGGAAASVYYFNLKNEIGNKMSFTWTNMGGGINAGTANLHIYDFDPTVNANYNTTGSNGANINGVLTEAEALPLYADVVSTLGFTPERIYKDALELSEASYYNICRIAAAANAGNNVTRTVQLTRAIGADKWNTIVLPFDMTADQVTSTFGEGTKLAQLTSGSTADNLKFTTATEITANQPYAIKVPTAITVAEPVNISGVTIMGGEPMPMQEVDGWQFQGTYTKGNVPQDSYFFSNNKLYRATDETNTIKAFRAWFTNTNSSAARQLSFTIDDETTSLIENGKWKIENYDATVYDLQGRRVRSAEANSSLFTNHSSLKPGVYIVNGKCVIIK